MKKILLPFLAATLVLGSVTASAETSFQATVDRVLPANSGVVDVMFNVASSACTSAQSPKRFRLQVNVSGMTSDGLKNVYTALLYAASFNKSVLVYFDESLASCNITRVLVYE